MKNNRAYTLVELLGVVTLIGLISVLVAPSIINQIRTKKEKLDNVTTQLIISATELYLDNKESSYPKTEGKIYCITLEQLVNDDKLESPILDMNGSEVNLDKKISVEIKNNNYDIKLNDSCIAN